MDVGLSRRPAGDGAEDSGDEAEDWGGGPDGFGGEPDVPPQRLTERVQAGPARFQEWWRELGRAVIDPGAAGPATFVKRARQAIEVVLVLGVGGFLIDGANRPANPYLLPAAGATGQIGMSPAGAATLSVSSAGGHSDRVCVLRALTAPQQEKGLMGMRTLGRYAGMAFVFDHPTTQSFYMKDTLIPLSIAWFGADGRFISSTDMPVCPPAAEVCPTYGAGAPYLLALEVPQGGLGALRVGPGATAQLGASC